MPMRDFSCDPLTRFALQARAVLELRPFAPCDIAMPLIHPETTATQGLASKTPCPRKERFLGSGLGIASMSVRV